MSIYCIPITHTQNILSFIGNTKTQTALVVIQPTSYVHSWLPWNFAQNKFWWPWKKSTGPKTNHRKTKKKQRDNQNKILRVLLIHFCGIQGWLLPKNSECTVDNMGKIQEKWRQSEEKRKCKIKEKSVNYRQFLSWRYLKTLITNRILAYFEGPTHNWWQTFQISHPKYIGTCLIQILALRLDGLYSYALLK